VRLQAIRLLPLAVEAAYRDAFVIRPIHWCRDPLVLSKYSLGTSPLGTAKSGIEGFEQSSVAEGLEQALHCTLFE